MEGLAFQRGAREDVVALYRRLVGDELTDGEQLARIAAWEGIAAALMQARDAAEAYGLGAAGLDALDLGLIAIARAAAYGQRVAFEAGLEAGAMGSDWIWSRMGPRPMPPRCRQGLDPATSPSPAAIGTRTIVASAGARPSARSGGRHADRHQRRGRRRSHPCLLASS